MTAHVYPPALTAPPLALATQDSFAFGTYDGPVRDADLTQAWSGLSRMWHASRTKEWQAFQAGNSDYFVLGAVYDAKVLGLLQVIVVEKATDRAWRFEHKVPTTALRVARGLHGTRSRGRWRGLEVTVSNHLDEGVIAVAANGDGPDGSLAMSITGSCTREEAGHVVICHAFPDGSPLYSNKTAMPASGILALDGRQVSLRPADSFLLLDDHKGHYPSPMVYDWVTGARVTADGQRVAFNLTHNQVADPDTFNENVVFSQGHVHRLPAVRFHRPRGVHGPWHIRDASGAVDVTFSPSVPNEQHVGPRSLLAEYYGPFGWFQGSIELADGSAVVVDDFYGMGERKNIRV